MGRNLLEDYLRKNPYTWDTKQGFCSRLNVGEGEIESAIVSLVDQGVLAIRGEGERALFGPASITVSSTQKSKQDWDEYGLTGREREVARCIAQGMLNQEIADTLHISIHTVKNHMTNIFKKLNVNDRSHAIVKLTHLFPSNQ